MLAARLADRGLQPPRLGGQDAAAQIGNLVVAPPLVVLLGRRTVIGLDDQILVEQPLEQRVERSAAQPDQAVGAGLDLTDDAVAVAFFVRQGQQDLERERRQRQERAGIGSGRVSVRQSGLRRTM